MWLRNLGSARFESHEYSHKKSCSKTQKIVIRKVDNILDRTNLNYDKKHESYINIQPRTTLKADNVVLYNLKNATKLL